MRRIRQPALLFASAVLLYLLFKNGTFDRACMSLFHDAANPSDSWPFGDAAWSVLLYHTAPFLTGLIALFSLGCILYPKAFRCFSDARMAGILLLLSTALGPGLLVNAVFKDNWGRPRPRETTEFGGSQSYVPPFLYNSKGNGKSFPCGHCSVGFVLAAPALLLVSRRHRNAWITIALMLGIALGISRMAAGGHFLSDVIASALITFIAIWIASLALRIDRVRQRHTPPEAQPILSWWKHHPVAGSLVATLVAIGLGIGALFAVPFEQSHLFVLFESDISPISAGTSPQLAIQTNIEHLQTRITPLPDGELFRLTGASRGFGAPGNRAAIRSRVVSPVLGYHAGVSLILETSGRFTELNHDLSLLVAPHVNLHIENIEDLSLDNQKGASLQ